MIHVYQTTTKKAEENHKFIEHILTRHVPNGTKIQIYRDMHGKPHCTNTTIKFNISHTQDQLIIAVFLDAIGVDIESASRVPSSKLRSRYQHPSEHTDLLTDIEYWVIKESASKYWGKGVKDIKNIQILSHTQPWAVVTNTQNHEDAWVYINSTTDWVWAVTTKNKNPIKFESI